MTASLPARLRHYHLGARGVELLPELRVHQLDRDAGSGSRSRKGDRRPGSDPRLRQLLHAVHATKNTVGIWQHARDTTDYGSLTGQR